MTKLAKLRDAASPDVLAKMGRMAAEHECREHPKTESCGVRSALRLAALAPTFVDLVEQARETLEAIPHNTTNHLRYSGSHTEAGNCRLACKKYRAALQVIAEIEAGL